MCVCVCVYIITCIYTPPNHNLSICFIFLPWRPWSMANSQWIYPSPCLSPLVSTTQTQFKYGERDHLWLAKLQHPARKNFNASRQLKQRRKHDKKDVKFHHKINLPEFLYCKAFAQYWIQICASHLQFQIQ